jgi:CubicO group peptidase (beta-lactamase class C family)
MEGFRIVVAAMAAALAAGAPVAAQDVARMVKRAKSLELPTPYAPPPGDPLSHHAAGFAKTMCSAVFITGLDLDFAAANVGYFTAPMEERAKLGKPVVDRSAREVRVTLPNGVRRTARYVGDQGCVTLPEGERALHFRPVAVPSKLPDPDRQPWPMGDAAAKEAPPKGIDLARIERALDQAFDPPAAQTAAMVITWRGRIVGERYAKGITRRTPLESWSMGKSLTATLLGILMREGVYRLDQPAPIPEWQGAGDPRRQIRISDILHMSSGVRIRAPLDPGYDAKGGYPDHLYLYTGGVNAFHYAATRPLEWAPGKVGRYRNTDPVLANYLIRLAVEGRKQDYLSFPRRALLDKLGIRTLVMETDAWGNFLTQGYEFASARDWARLGNLYLQDGVWMGERLLPERFVKFVSTLAPSWLEDGRPIYGGFFWINGDGRFPLPKETYYMAGAGGQYTIIEPSRELVIARLGHFSGAAPGMRSLNAALKTLMEAIPPSR